MTKQLSCTLKDLIPGSYYRFRIRSVCKSGISEPSKPSERIFIGRPLEDEVFGLPGGNYPKERPSRSLHHYGTSRKRYSSLEENLPQGAEEDEAGLAASRPPAKVATLLDTPRETPNFVNF